MKANLFQSLLFIAMMMMFGVIEVSAASQDVTMQVGETQTLYLPTSVTGKKLKSVSFYSNGVSYVQVVSYTNYSVKVKAVKAFSSPIVVRCDYYYYVTSGSYTYQAKGYYDFNVTVVGETKVQPTKITLPKVVSVEVGESKELVPTVTPVNAEYTLTWKISNSSVASVYQNGTITGKSVGETDLKVSADNGVYTMCRIVVYKPSASSVSMKSSLALSVGESSYLTPTVYPTNADYTLSWSSSDVNVATVSSSGKVVATGVGAANIVVQTNNGKKATCAVTVSAPQASVTITDAKYATFSNAYSRDFSNTGITVYTAMCVDGSRVILTEVEDGVVPANTAVLLYKDVDNDATLSVPDTSVRKTTLADNQLLVSDGVTAKGDEIYVLANQSNGVGFYHWASENSLSAGKVYLRVPETSGVRAFLDLSDEMTTRISDVTFPKNEDAVYDLMGRRLLNPQKGIYVVNGKKVIRKTRSVWGDEEK